MADEFKSSGTESFSIFYFTLVLDQSSCCRRGSVSSILTLNTNLERNSKHLQMRRQAIIFCLDTNFLRESVTEVFKWRWGRRATVEIQMSFSSNISLTKQETRCNSIPFLFLFPAQVTCRLSPRSSVVVAVWRWLKVSVLTRLTIKRARMSRICKNVMPCIVVTEYYTGAHHCKGFSRYHALVKVVVNT